MKYIKDVYYINRIITLVKKRQEDLFEDMTIEEIYNNAA
jgi:hypothetical protein